jgi:hypothetical protein
VHRPGRHDAGLHEDPGDAVEQRAHRVLPDRRPDPPLVDLLEVVLHRRRRGGELHGADGVERGHQRPPEGRAQVARLLRGGAGERRTRAAHERGEQQDGGRHHAGQQAPSGHRRGDDHGRAERHVDPAVGVDDEAVGVEGAGGDLARRRLRQALLARLPAQDREAQAQRHRAHHSG